MAHQGCGMSRAWHGMGGHVDVTSQSSIGREGGRGVKMGEGGVTAQCMWWGDLEVIEGVSVC